MTSVGCGIGVSALVFCEHLVTAWKCPRCWSLIFTCAPIGFNMNKVGKTRHRCYCMLRVRIWSQQRRCQDRHTSVWSCLGVAKQPAKGVKRGHSVTARALPIITRKHQSQFEQSTRAVHDRSRNISNWNGVKYLGTFLYSRWYRVLW